MIRSDWNGWCEHIGLENNLYWVLDITFFDEDSNRTHKGHRAANLAVIRHIALNLIKAEKPLGSASRSSD
jgi:predicted transposase YbfD/YdcC